MCIMWCLCVHRLGTEEISMRSVRYTIPTTHTSLYSVLATSFWSPPLFQPIVHWQMITLASPSPFGHKLSLEKILVIREFTLTLRAAERGTRLLLLLLRTTHISKNISQKTFYKFRLLVVELHQGHFFPFSLALAAVYSTAIIQFAPLMAPMKGQGDTFRDILGSFGVFGSVVERRYWNWLWSLVAPLFSPSARHLAKGSESLYTPLFFASSARTNPISSRRLVFKRKMNLFLSLCLPHNALYYKKRDRKSQ